MNYTKGSELLINKRLQRSVSGFYSMENAVFKELSMQVKTWGTSGRQEKLNFMQLLWLL